MRVLESIDRKWKEDMKDVSSKFAKRGCCLAFLLRTSSRSEYKFNIRSY
jgi:hypothetical protein